MGQVYSVNGISLEFPDSIDNTQIKKENLMNLRNTLDVLFHVHVQVGRK